MDYKNITTDVLKIFHDSIYKCLEIDDKTPNGIMKPYGVREFSDWKDHLLKIEGELKDRKEQFVPIIIESSNSDTAPKPIELSLYERISSLLEFEDSLPQGSKKTHGVREFKDWKKQADSLEKTLESKSIIFKKIKW